MDDQTFQGMHVGHLSSSVPPVPGSPFIPVPLSFPEPFFAPSVLPPASALVTPGPGGPVRGATSPAQAGCRSARLFGDGVARSMLGPIRGLS